MNVQEMHIEVRQGLNQMGANRGGKYDQDQIDWVLNKMQDRYIPSCLKSKDNGGFEVDQLKTDAIKNLIVSGIPLNAYIDGTTRYKAFLPPDYRYLLADGSFTRPLGIEAPVTATRTLYLDALRQARSVKSSAPYYNPNVVSIKGTTVSIPADLPYGNTYTGYNSTKDILFLVPYIVAKAGWYWEKAAGESYPEHFIRLSEDAGTGNNSVTVDGTSYTVGTSKTLSLMVHTNVGSYNDNRLTASDQAPSMRTNFFYKSSYYSPISELSDNILYVYRDDSFTVSGVVISYVRKPQTISLSLNTSSELSSDGCRAICDLAIEYIKGPVLENVQGQQLKQNDLDRRVTL